MSLQQIYKPVEPELKAVEAQLEAVILAPANEVALEIGRFILASPGKRIRPALTLLAAKASSGPNEPSDSHEISSLIKIASAVELIHMASLVHDDVIDRSEMRHSKPSVNSLWGEDASVAFGDFLYSLSSQLTTECENFRLHACMSQATRDMSEGELLQVCERENLSLSRESYLSIIQKKTAGLFAAACEAGAVAFGANSSTCQTMRQFGLLLGVAFQIIDDYLDLVGEEKNLGKAPGQDIDVGKLTLPLLYLLEEAPVSERRHIKTLLLESRDPASFAELKLKLSESQAEQRTIQDITAYLNQARNALTRLPISPAQESLETLVDFIIERALSYTASQS